MNRKLALVLLVVCLLALPVGGCTKPLTLTVITPADGAIVNESVIEVRVLVSDDKATVWVNDVMVVVSTAMKKGGNFSTTITLIEGENTIEVVAAQGKEGKWKNTVGRTVTVTYKPQ